QEKIEKEDPEFKDLPKYHQNAIVYASPHLASWIQAIRASYFYVLLVNGQFDVPFDYSVERDEGITWEVDGPTDVDGEMMLVDLSLKGLKNVNRDSATYYKRVTYYPPFESKNVRAFVKNGLERRDAERELVVKSNTGFTSQDVLEAFKEIAYVDLNSDLCIPSILSFFTRHPEHLSDADYQILFEQMVFRVGYVQRALELSGFVDKIVSFFAGRVQESLNDNQIQTCQFLARMCRYFSRFIPDALLQEYQLPLLRKLLEIQGLETFQKGAIYAEICAHLSGQDILDQRDIEELLVGSVFINHHPLPDNWTNEYVKRDIADALHKHAVQIEQALISNGQPNHALLNTILKGFKPAAADEKWIVRREQGQYPHFETESKNHECYPLVGELTYPGITVRLPFTITQHRDFAELFPSIHNGVQLERNRFAFQVDGVETRVMLKDGTLVIDQLRGSPKKWHRFVPKGEFEAQESSIKEPRSARAESKSPLYSVHLVDQCHAWRELDADPVKLLLIDPATKAEKYSASFKKKQESSLEGAVKVDQGRRQSDGALLGVSSS
ncbi:MAG: hypothetical protein JSR46_08520, partial [Verrucomicrobia bacterium]|nr:hypothetical protein [Verrucomicrobiota bacterium]